MILQFCEGCAHQLHRLGSRTLENHKLSPWVECREDAVQELHVRMERIQVLVMARGSERD